MNDRTKAADAQARIADLFERQRRAFDALPCPEAATRRESLRALKQQLVRHQDELADAIPHAGSSGARRKNRRRSCCATIRCRTPPCASRTERERFGVGNSGMGTYHGVEGFRELSHARTVFKRHRFFPIGLFYPPYGNFVQRLALRWFLGRKPQP